MIWERGALAGVFFRCAQRIAGPGAAAIAHAQIEGTDTDEFTVVDPGLPAGHAPTLQLDFRVFDKIAGGAAPTAEGHTGLTHGIAIDHPRDLDLIGAATALVGVSLVGPGNRLVVVVFAGGEAQLPIVIGHRVMHGMSLGAAVAAFAAAQVMVETDIEQVVERRQVVQRQGDVALVFTGLLAAGVVHRQADPYRNGLLPSDHHVALPRLRILALGRFDLHIGFGGGHTLEVLQCLLDIAQVKHVAGGRGHRVPVIGA